MSTTTHYRPAYDHAAGVVHVPVIGEPRTATLDIETFETLQLRGDILATPLRLGRDHGAPAIRAKVLNPAEGEPRTVSLAALIAPPGRCHKSLALNGNPFDLRRCNVGVVSADKALG
jgi:hypothetical protein